MIEGMKPESAIIAQFQAADRLAAARALARRPAPRVNIAPHHGFIKRHPIASAVGVIAAGQLGAEAVGTSVTPHAHLFNPDAGPHVIAVGIGTVGALLAKDVVGNSQWYQRRALAREERHADKAAARVGRTLSPSPVFNDITE